MATASARRLGQALRDEVREELRRVVQLDALADKSDEVGQTVRSLIDAAKPPGRCSRESRRFPIQRVS